MPNEWGYPSRGPNVPDGTFRAAVIVLLSAFLLFGAVTGGVLIHEERTSNGICWESE